MKIVVIEPLGISQKKLENISRKLKKYNFDFTYYSQKTENTTELIERAKTADIIILANLPFKKEIIEKCSKLKLISVAFTGVDHIDIEFCKKRKITVCNAAGYSTNAVAELTFGLAITVFRKIISCDKATKTNKSRGSLLGRELYNKKFGIIGTGEIGLKVARIAKTFGCDIIAYSRTQKKEAEEIGIKYMELEDLLKECDILSLHLPLNQNTKNMIDENKIALLKPNSIVINTARGSIIDNTALAKALNEEKISGAGIDVFETEPPLGSHPLLTAKNTVLAPHIGFATEEALYTRAEIVFENIAKWIENNPQNLIV